MMRRSWALLPLFSLVYSPVSARYLGPLDPPPVDLTSKASLVRSQWESLTSTLKDHFNGRQSDDSLSFLDKITFSLGLFSVHDQDGCLQYHHTGPDVRNSTLGVNSVDGNSIYRLASMSKIFTVYAGLLLLDPSDWHKPLTEIFPEISSLPTDDPVHHVQWDTITPFSLASQISGVPRDARPFDVGEISTSLAQAEPEPIDPTTLGLPPLTTNSTGINVPCQTLTCSAVEYIQGIQGPILPVFQSPGYADTNFILLGRVISKLTGLPTNEEWFQKAVLGPLDMKNTSSVSPTKKPYAGYVVTGDPEAFAFQGEITSSSGGVFSTTNDVAKLGVSILNSTLMPADLTRRWMKPTTFTAGLEFAHGMGWEIYRYTDKKTGHVTDLYTKLGDSGSYASYLVLVPDYDFGFSVLLGSGIAAAAERSAAAQLLADMVSETILPALRDQAAAETMRNYEGTYIAKGHAPSTNASTSTSTSTLTLEYNQTAGAGFGLTITSLVNDGHDLLAYLKRLQGNADQLVLAPSTYDPVNKRRGFVITPVVEEGGYTGLFSKQMATNADWLLNSVYTYGGQAMGTIYFDVADDGTAVAASPAPLRGKRFVKSTSA
ncbi:beta-lactamase/transpeptidase-like protein [Poronia punctata]|nr:beta-lactamase/transpeptidase-like protein [Poronia punctata]